MTVSILIIIYSVSLIMGGYAVGYSIGKIRGFIEGIDELNCKEDKA